MVETLMMFPDKYADSVQPRKSNARNRPAPLGTGPDDEKCKGCEHFVRLVMSKTYFKCGLINWTHGSATDIRANDPACEKWEENSD